MMNNVCFLGPFLQLNVGSVEKETEPADYNPNSTRSEKVRFMDSDQVNDNKIINDGMICPLWMPESAWRQSVLCFHVFVFIPYSSEFSSYPVG